jgi:hypothetical protein
MSETVRGFAFPFRIDPLTGGVALRSGDDKIRDNITQILLTGAGERIMDRDYGVGLRQILHDPNDDALASIAIYQIARAVARLEPRVLLQDVRFERQDTTLSIAVLYVVRRTRQTQSVSVPFGFA